MRAVRLHGAGPGATLRVDDVAPPRPPRGDEVLVRVSASSVNGTDTGIASRAALRARPRPLGFDLVGEVVALGPRVTSLALGDTVVALLGHSGGAQAELVLVPAGRTARAPTTATPAQAGGLPLAGLTALQALHGQAALHVRTRPTVLVVGAAGGIGCFAVQIARIAGARVTALADDARAGFVRGLGAETVLDRRSVDLAAPDERWDVVVDAPGALDPGVARGLLRPGGTAVSTRPISREALTALATARLRSSPPPYTGVMAAARTGDLDRLVALVDAGELVVPVDATHPLEDVAAAHRHVGGGGVRGKVVLLV